MGQNHDSLQNRRQSPNSYDRQQQQVMWGQQSPYPQHGAYAQPYRPPPSSDYGPRYQTDVYSPSNNGYLPPPPRHPASMRRSWDDAPAYSQDYPSADQQQNIAPYGNQNYTASSPYPQQGQNYLQPAVTTTSMAPGRLRRPFVLPQTAAAASAPFLRGFSDELENAGVSQRDFIQFVDALNLTIVPNPEMQLANTAAGIAGWFVPGLGGLALTGVQIAAQVGGAVHVKGATQTCIERANQTVFAPCGLEVQLLSTEQFNKLLGIYTSATPPGSYALEPVDRLQFYNSYITPLSTVLPPVQGGGRQDALAQLGTSMANRKQAKQQRKAEKDAAKGKMKKATKLDTSFRWLVVMNSAQGVIGSTVSGTGSWTESQDEAAMGAQASPGPYGRHDEYYQDKYSPSRKH